MLIGTILTHRVNPFDIFPANGGPDWPGELQFKVTPVVGKALKNLVYWELHGWDLDMKLVEKLQKKVKVKVIPGPKDPDLSIWAFEAFVLREDPQTGEVHVWEFKKK